MKNNNNIYETKDYSIFKQLKGNRPIRPALVKRIKMDLKEFDKIHHLHNQYQ